MAPITVPLVKKTTKGYGNMASSMLVLVLHRHVDFFFENQPNWDVAHISDTIPEQNYIMTPVDTANLKSKCVVIIAVFLTLILVSLNGGYSQSWHGMGRKQVHISKWRALTEYRKWHAND